MDVLEAKFQEIGKKVEELQSFLAEGRSQRIKQLSKFPHITPSKPKRNRQKF